MNELFDALFADPQLCIVHSILLIGSVLAVLFSLAIHRSNQVLRRENQRGEDS